MKDILKFKKCPVSGLPITTKPEWKYKAKDGSCTIEIAIIGDNILYEIPIGIIDGEANKWYTKTASKIIADYFGNRKYYFAYDYSLMENASLEAKKVFINWLISNSDKIELVTVFGMNQIIKVAIKTARIISKKIDKLILTNSYQESIHTILRKEKSNGILSYQKCPVSGLPININNEWKYENKDDSFSVEMGKIGESIIFISVVGSVSVRTIEATTIIINRIINQHPNTVPLYLVFDYSKLIKESIQTKKTFVNWLLAVLDKVEKIIFFGVNNTLKLTINATKIISSKFYKVTVSDTYQDAIKYIMEGKGEYLNKGEKGNNRINELIGYLGKMTWTGDLNQKIPVLPKDDTFAELFAAVAANQEDLREIEKDRDEAHKKLEKTISEKDEALKSVSDNELVILKMLENVQAQETETKKANEQLETIIKGANLGWWDWDIPTGDEIFNEILAENLGYKLSEITPHIKWWEGKIHPDDEKQVFEYIQNYFDGKTEYYQHKHRLKTKSGKWKWFLDFGKVVERDKDGKAIRMIGILRDIDKEERAEQTLRQSEEKYRLLTETMKDVVIRISATGELLYVSPAIKKFGGYKPEEEVGSNMLKYFAEEDDYQRAVKLITEIIETHKSGHFEFMFKTKNTVPFPVEHTFVPLISNNKVYAIQMVLRDISERKKAEQALKESEAKLRESNKTKDKFFSIIAHDLKSPFNTMLGFSQLLINKFEKYDIQKQKKFLGILNSDIKNTYKLLENLLLWSQSQRGTIDFKPEKENLYLLVAETIDILSQTATNKSIIIKNEISESTLVKADKDMLATIIRVVSSKLV
ncbi:MAG: hypothetical protein B6I20_03230 [Bacteroidetes bacterium 4572_117]|nr:MAG: hypothetical protein B6I20_03230 [Bacteroidetes bacterium 4572_117]